MSFITKLAAYTLRQMLGNSTAIYVEKLGQFFVDPTQALPTALNLANQQTWQLMELALAGDKLSERLKRWLISGQMRGILQPLREQVQQLGSNFRSECLGELQAARSAGVLAVGTGQELIALGQDVRVMVEPAALLAGAQQVVTQAVDGLLPYPRLAQLLGNHDGGGALLITAFEYFLRQEIGKQPRLREELQINLLQQLAQDQLAGWEELHRLLTEQRTEIGEELTGISQGLEEVLIMVREIRAILPNSAQRGPVSPRHSSVLRSAADVKLLAELERRLSTMPPASHTPELLDAIGRLAMGVGMFNQAGERFSQAATAASAMGEVTMQAEAHYNTYRALLEQRRWDEALVAMLAAAQLDPKRFALFPLDDYIPQRILGAGGFGVAFLCNHAHLGELQVVKTLHTEELQLDAGRDIATIFREGSILTRLQHPSIIGVKHAGFAAPNKQRPYLAMEYFPGVSLGDYLTQHGCLNLEQTLALAKPVAEALKAAHEQGIWHRDLKPDNLLVRVDKACGWVVKLIDFGLAVRGKVVQAGVVTGVTNQSIMGQALGGTYQFSAPEQLGIVVGKVGPWSDVYAFGKTLAYALFLSTQPTARNYRQLGNSPLVDLLSDCLEQDIDQRPQDFGAVLQVLNTENAANSQQENAETASKAQEEQQRQAADAKRWQQEAETSRKNLEEQQRQAAEAVRKQQEAERKLREAEAARKAVEEQQRQATVVKRKQQEADAAHKNQEEQQRQAAEAKRKQQESDAAHKAQEEVRRRNIAPLVESIHGWSADKVQALQKRTAEFLNTPVEYQHNLKSGGKGPVMVVIPAGKFLMGSPDNELGRFRDEGPLHEVTLAKPLAMGKFAVTFDDYDRFCAATNTKKPGDEDWGRGHRPVINVSWGDAAAYCAWLSVETGHKYRLPSEAEWEYCCRAGSTTPFFWGNTITPKQANYNGNYEYGKANIWSEIKKVFINNIYRQKTVPVEEFLPNAWGLHQMQGNVWEWTCSEYDVAYNGKENRCSKKSNNVARSVRGGSWYNEPLGVRAAFRNNDASSSSNDNIGFRLIQD